VTKRQQGRKNGTSRPWPEHGMDAAAQPPEFWNQFQTDFAPGTHVRIHPLLHWTELNVWEYIERERIPVIPLYFDDGTGHRYRSLGCAPCTAPGCCTTRARCSRASTNSSSQLPRDAACCSSSRITARLFWLGLNPLTTGRPYTFKLTTDRSTSSSHLRVHTHEVSVGHVARRVQARAEAGPARDAVGAVRGRVALLSRAPERGLGESGPSRVHAREAGARRGSTGAATWTSSTSCRRPYSYQNWIVGRAR